MSRVCRLSKLAAKQFRRLPRDRQKQIARSLDEMATDPTVGDVRIIKAGKFKGAFRKRVGHYRIIFALDPELRMIEVATILSRTDTTYN
ncbi:MAG: hypothetical protein HYT46_00775 [Candidatus Vogelbacteria bacterium]|nr:hypothetical protein [Candidatus Vogelbacteria bacterium]